MQRMTNDLAELFGALPSRPSNLKPRSFASVTHALKLSITDIFATCVPSLLVAAELGVAATALTTIKAVAEKMMHRMACLLCSTDSTRPFTLPLYGMRKEIMRLETFKDGMISFRGLPSVFIERKDLYEFALLFKSNPSGARAGFDRNGSAWFGSRGGSIVELDTRQRKVREYWPPVAPVEFYEAMPDRNGEVWAGELQAPDSSGSIPERISGSNTQCRNRMRTTGEPGLTIPQTRFPSGTWITKATSCAYSPWIKAWRTARARLPSATARSLFLLVEHLDVAQMGRSVTRPPNAVRVRWIYFNPSRIRLHDRQRELRPRFRLGIEAGDLVRRL